MEPIAPLDRRRKQTFDEAIGTRTRRHAGGQRNECKRHEAIRDNPVPIERRVLGVATVASPPTASSILRHPAMRTGPASRT